MPSSVASLPPWSLVFFLISCGSPSVSQAPHPLPSATASIPSTKRSPSAAVSKYVAPNATLFAYADLEGFFQTKLGSGLTPDIAKLAGGDGSKCIAAIAASGKELLISSGDGGLAGVLRFDPAKMDASACPMSVSEPGIALFGPAKAGPGKLPSIALDRDEYARAVFDEKPIAARVSLTLSDALFALHADGDVPEKMAREMSANFERERAMLPTAMKDATSEERETIGRLLRFTTFKQNGTHVSLAIDLHEAPLDQARDIGTMASLAIAGVRKYLIASKQAEVRNNLSFIARGIAEEWEREPLPGTLATPRAKKKLRSFPAVPATVPRGTKYESTQADWAPWSALHFEIDQPQYFQYEVRAAKDGLSADVIGRGDLNGDGKTSAFVITVKVKNDKTRTLEIAPTIAETDPDE